MKYLNFDIKISGECESEYTLNLVDCPLPLQTSQQEPFSAPTAFEVSDRLVKLSILKSPQPTLSFPRTQREQEMRKFGATLYHALFAGQIGAMYRKCLNLLRDRDDVGLLIRLEIEPPELRKIPWEYAYGDHLDGPDFLALSPLTPIVRYIGKEKDFKANDLASILVLAANPTHDMENLDFAREQTTVLRVCKGQNLKADGYEQVGTANLQAYFNQHRPSILHFIGHGEQKEGKGYLYLEGIAGTAQPIAADKLWEIVKHNRKLHLAVLNACQSESTAYWMVSNGLPASVSMQFEIADKASVVFFEAFYTSLLVNHSLALAVHSGRQAMRLSLAQSKPGELAYGLQWGLPVVYMAGDDSEAIFEAPTAPQDICLIDAVLKVTFGLDHLKLSGTPVNIAILPDLVFDLLHEISVQEPRKRRKKKRPEGFSRDIGGHTGIAVKTLSTLQNKDDGTYNVQCIVKTGALGRAVLEEYLIRYAHQRNVMAPDMSHVMTNGQSREQVLGMLGETEVRRRARLDPERDMCLDDLRNHPTRPLELIQSANVTGWLSTKSRVFSELMNSLQTDTLNLSGCLFVNVNVHLDEPDADERNQNIFDMLLNTRIGGRSPIDVLSMGKREAIALAQAVYGEVDDEQDAFEAATMLHEQLEITTLYHTDRYVVLFREGTATAIPTFRIEKPLLPTGAGDTLNAGVMLAIAVRDALELCHHPVLPELKLSFEECVLFGIIVASCRLVGGEYPTQDDILTFAAENYGRLYIQDLLPPDESGDRDVRMISVIDRLEYHYQDLPTLFVGLSGQHPLLSRLFAASKLGQQHQPEVITALRELLEDDNDLIVAAAVRALHKMPRELLPGCSDERRVVLVDLDNMLWDARSSRIEASIWSIRRLKHEISRLNRDIVYDVDLYRQWQVCAITDVPDAEVEQLVQLYEADVYGSGIIFEIMGHPNFRRLWNTPESYAVLLALAHTSDNQPEGNYVNKQRVLNKIRQARENIKAIDQAIDQQALGEEEKRYEIEKIVRVLERDEDIVHLKRLLDQIAMDPLLGEPISDAADEFEIAPIRPFADARDFLQSLVEIEGCELCGVTGGPTREEWKRIKRFGLGDLIPPERLLSTQSAARPKADLETLEQALLTVEKQIQDIRLKKSRLEEDVALYDELVEVPGEPEVVQEKREILVKQIQKLDGELQLLDQHLSPMVYVRDLFERFFYKRGRPFYARCIHAVHEGKSNPRDFLNSFSPAERVDWDQGIPIKLAVVGDRYDDDLRPLIQIYGDDVCSIRVLRGHWRDKHTDKDLDALGWPKPTRQVETLAQARNFLVKPSLWENLVPVRQPPIFEETVGEHNIGNLLRAFGMQPDILAKVAKSVIDENTRDNEKVKNLSCALETHLRTEPGETISKRRAIEVLGIVGAHPAIIDRVYALLLNQLCQSQDMTFRDSIIFALASTLVPGDNRWEDVERHVTPLERERLRRLRTRYRN